MQTSILLLIEIWIRNSIVGIVLMGYPKYPLSLPISEAPVPEDPGLFLLREIKLKRKFRFKIPSRDWVK